jgi:hypothetical protein
LFTLEIIISWLNVAPLVEADAVVGIAENTAFGGWEEDETLEAAHLDESVISALVELVTVALVRNINLVIAFSALIFH